VGRGGRCVRLTTLPPSCAVIMKSGNLNFLEPSVPLQTCNGTAVPFKIVHQVGFHYADLKFIIVENLSEDSAEHQQYKFPSLETS